MNIDKVMSERLVTVRMDDTLEKVRAIFEREGFHHLLVVEQGWGDEPL